MFAFAQKVVKTLEQSADSIINGAGDNDSILASDSYFSNLRYAKYGLRVLSVKEESQAVEQGLESWFDYIIGINGHEIPTNYNESHELVPNYEYFFNEINNSPNKVVRFEVWCAKGGIIKNVEFKVESNQLEEIPLTANPNPVPEQILFKKLGFSVQWTPVITSTYVYHVLEIYPNSVAERAGLIEHSDYIIGAQDGLLATGGEDLLKRMIISKKNQSITLYVYNHDFNVVRPVTVNIVDNNQGGSLLGCGIGYGFLHRLPPVVSNFAPGSVLFDSYSNFNSQTSLVPPGAAPAATGPPASSTIAAQPLDAPPIGLAASQPPTHTNRKKKTTPINNDILDYLNTESEKSRKLDNQGQSYSNLPPPPTTANK